MVSEQTFATGRDQGSVKFGDLEQLNINKGPTVIIIPVKAHRHRAGSRWTAYTSDEMPLLLNFDKKTKNIYAADQSTKDILASGCFGVAQEGRLLLAPEEGLYLMDVRNATCTARKRKRRLCHSMRSHRNSARARSSWRDISHTKTGATADS